MSEFEDYDGFVEKFKPKKTTDDCYTPPVVYEAVKRWACDEYGIDPGSCVRPFYPGGDFYRFDYPDGCTVLDNPPFSILAKICSFYIREGISFFLFAPSLTCLSGRKLARRMNHIVTDCTVTYENGAEVKTSFVTSYGYPEVYRTAPDLTEAVNRANDENLAAGRRQLPKYQYPYNVLTAAMGQRYARYGVDFRVTADQCLPISKLDSQAAAGKGIFGGGATPERREGSRTCGSRTCGSRTCGSRTCGSRTCGSRKVGAEQEGAGCDKEAEREEVTRWVSDVRGCLEAPRWHNARGRDQRWRGPFSCRCDHAARGDGTWLQTPGQGTATRAGS